MSQNEMIKADLEKGARITPMDALRSYGCLRLGARIWDLRRKGMQVQKRLIEVPGKRGVTKHVAEYFIPHAKGR